MHAPNDTLFPQNHISCSVCFITMSSGLEGGVAEGLFLAHAVCSDFDCYHDNMATISQ